MVLANITTVNVPGMKPCPFCGMLPVVQYELKATGMVDLSTHKRIMRKEYYVIHVNKECMIGGLLERVGGWSFDSAKETKEFWNRRAR